MSYAINYAARRSEIIAHNFFSWLISIYFKRFTLFSLGLDNDLHGLCFQNASESLKGAGVT